MKLIGIASRYLAVLACALLVYGCAAVLKHKENLASAAGFKPITPRTAHQEQLLATLPVASVTRVTWNHKMYYVLPDAKHGVAYIGGQKEYRQYCLLLFQEEQTQENLDAANMNENAARAWGWGSWGGWNNPAPTGFW